MNPFGSLGYPWFFPGASRNGSTGWIVGSSSFLQVTGRRVAAIQQTAELVTAAGGEGARRVKSGGVKTTLGSSRKTLMCIPGTQMTLVLVGKGLVLEG